MTKCPDRPRTGPTLPRGALRGFPVQSIVHSSCNVVTQGVVDQMGR